MDTGPQIDCATINSLSHANWSISSLWGAWNGITEMHKAHEFYAKHLATFIWKILGNYAKRLNRM